MPLPSSASQAVRRFNRFYTRRIGVLQERLVDSGFTLAESRLLWEFAHREHTTAAELARDLDLDPGYLSRLLRGLKARGLVGSERATGDARRLRLAITPAGRAAFAPLDRNTESQVQAMLSALAEPAQRTLLRAMAEIEALLDPPGHEPAPWLLRPLRIGDLGWVIARHGALYAAEYGWDARFEALVARIGADFVDRFDAEREAGWIAERHGANAGCVFLVGARDDATGALLPGVAQLRMLLVEPSARGAGIGARLVAECERFAREKGYRRIVLWTNSVLVGARAIYGRAGYVMTGSEAHVSFGHSLVGETWEKALDPAGG